MNNKKRTFITIVCSILLIMPSFLGVPLADGNLVLVPTPDSGQVNDEISTITDLNDDNIKTIITTELLLQAELEQSDLSDSDEIQGHAIRTGNGNDDNSNSYMPTEYSGHTESDQSTPSNVVAETTLIPQEQFPVENASEPTPSWPLIPGYGGFGNGTDSISSLADLETLPTGYVNSSIVNDASLPNDMNLTTAEDALLNMPLNAIDTDEGTYTIVEQLDPLNGTLGIVASNETTLTPTPDLTGMITFTIETTGSELGGDTANGVYDDSLTLINSSQPIFGTLTIEQNNTIMYSADLSSNTSDSIQNTISDGDEGANTEMIFSSVNDINQPIIETDDIGITIAENLPIAANDFDTGIDSLVDSSLIQGSYETVAENDDENTAFTSESITVEGSDLSSTDSVNTIESTTNSGSSDDDDNNSNYSSSDEDHDDDGQCSDNSAHDHGQDKHKDKDKHRDGSRGNGEANDDEHHADSEITHDNVSHEDSDHHNSEGSDNDRDHHDEGEGENNHDDGDDDDHDDDE